MALRREESERDRGDEELMNLTPHVAVDPTVQQQSSSRAALHQGGHSATTGHGRGKQPSLVPLIDLETEGPIPVTAAHAQGEQQFCISPRDTLI